MMFQSWKICLSNMLKKIWTAKIIGIVLVCLITGVMLDWLHVLPLGTQTPVLAQRSAQIGDTVKVNYNGTLDDGTVFDSTIDESFGHPDPFEFTIGAGQVIPSLDKAIPGFDTAMIGWSVGETKTVYIPAEEAFGLKYFEVSLSDLPSDIQVGESLYRQNEDGSTMEVTVANISESSATLENTHPLAGEVLTFEITLVEIIDEGAPPPSSSFPTWIYGAIAAAVVLIVVVPGLLLVNRRIAARKVVNGRVKQLRAKMEKWRTEGYDVSELEDLFK